VARDTAALVTTSITTRRVNRPTSAVWASMASLEPLTAGDSDPDTPSTPLTARSPTACARPWGVRLCSRLPRAGHGRAVDDAAVAARAAAQARPSDEATVATTAAHGSRSAGQATRSADDTAVATVTAVPG